MGRLRPFIKPPVFALMLTAAVVGALGGINSWADNDLPRIKFLATGGTIATRGGTRLSAEEVLQMVPGLGRYARPDPEQFTNVASTAMTLDQWVQLANRVNTVFDSDSGLTGAVITSGTDSLEELAYFLHLTVKTTKPVIVVGSMRNAGAPGFEGPANLLDAFRVAAAPDSRGKGVLVVLNDEINSAREVTKTDALRLQTFQSRPYGILGVVDPDRVVYYREPVKRHTQKAEFDVSALTGLPRVDIMMFYQGASSDLMRAAVDSGAKGIVIAVAGADLTGGSLAPGIAYAERQGVMVVAATRTGSGRIAALSSNRVREGLIGGEDLTPLKARILLMLALTKTHTPTDIQRMFTEY
jgi:L-asparaginase